MCGIAGYFNPKINHSENPKNCFKILQNMIKSMSMRGPDHSDYRIINSCCMAHSRLSVIDLTTGDQPLWVSDSGNNYYIVYNGEVYNYRELRKELKNKGIVFHTDSDSEVVLQSFIHYGPSFVHKLNGIFAFAIYDEKRNTLYLYRDRFGVKPLYYTHFMGTLIFASRIDTLFEYPGVKPCIDINGFNEIFALGPSKTYGSGVFTGIKEVLPGEYIVTSSDYCKHNQYYKLHSVLHEDSYDDTIEKIAYLVEDAVRLQMVSDVPICTFLSGGLDSSLVTSICCKHCTDKMTTFSFDFENNNRHFITNSFQPSEDRPYVDIMVNHLGTDHHYLTMSNQKLFDLLTASVDTRSLPTMADIDSSLLYFCGEVSKTHKVALTGECADEIFGGYPWFHREDMLYSDTFPWMMDISFRKSLLNPEFAAVLNMERYIQNAYNKTASEVELIPTENQLEERRRRISYINIKWFMQTLLDRMDRTSMQNGLEARVPFADYRIVEYLYNLPWDIKAKDGTPKNALRVVARRFLPDAIFNRPKSPYPKTYNPEYERLLVDRLKEIIHDSSAPIRSYLNLPSVEKFLDSPKEYGKPWFGQLMAGPQMIAYLIQINYWFEKYSLSM